MNRLCFLPCLALVLAGCGGGKPPAATAPAIPASAAASAPASAAATPAAPSATIPARFHGEWNTRLADCGTARNDSRLRVDAQRVRFHESSGTVREVQARGADEIAVTLELSGEGQSWRTERRWRLANGGATLHDVTDGAGLVRRRCPLGPATRP